MAPVRPPFHLYPITFHLWFLWCYIARDIAYFTMNKVLMLKLGKLVLALGFIGVIVVSYFQNHPTYAAAIGNNKGVVIPLLLVLLFVIGGWAFAHYMNHNEQEVQLHWRPYKVMALLPLLLVIVLTIYFAGSSFNSTTISQLIHGNASELTWTAMLWAFGGHVLPILFFLLGFTLLLAGLGYRIFQWLHWQLEDRLERMVLGTALGLTILITLFATLALFGGFTFWPVIVVIVVMALLIWGNWRTVLKDFLWDEITLRFAYNQMTWVWCLILFIVIAFNIIDLVRPYPIGWDDLGVYMNFPRQIALNGAFIKGFPGQAFMLITSLGYMLGQSATLAMFLAWWGGILALWALYLIGKRFINSEAGILFAALMYGLPMTMHQSFADMKLDMPLFFFIIVGFYTVFRALELRNKDKNISYWWLVLSGVFWGMALAVKVTTVLALFPLFIILAWRYGSIWLALAVGFTLHAFYFYQLVLTPDISPFVRSWIAIISLALACVCAAVALWKRSQLKQLAHVFLTLILGMVLVWIPWTYKILSDTPVWTPFNLLFTLLSGGPSSGPSIAWDKIGVNPGVCNYTAGTEELGRYIGHEQNLLVKYSSVFWDLTMNINQAGFYVDISFLFLGLIPLLLLFWKRKYWPEFWQNIILCFVLIWYFWLFVASGVPWYGLAGFLPGLFLIVRVKELAKEELWGGSYLIPFVILTSLISTLFLRESRFANTGQMAYAFDLLAAQDVLSSTNQSYPTMIAALNSDHATSTSPHYIYRVGTFINYFIDNNRERVYDDAQLDAFHCIDGDGSNDARTVNRLRQLGFHYMIYDTNTESIERNPQGTLHRKTQRFKEFALKNLKIVAPKDPSQYRNGIILFEIPQ